MKTLTALEYLKAGHEGARAQLARGRGLLTDLALKMAHREPGQLNDMNSMYLDFAQSLADNGDTVAKMYRVIGMCEYVEKTNGKVITDEGVTSEAVDLVKVVQQGLDLVLNRMETVIKHY